MMPARSSSRSAPMVLRPYDPADAIDPNVAADLAGVTCETARQWAASHDIGRKVGGRWKLSRAALLMFLDGNRGALRAYLSGDRTSPEVRAYLNRK